MPESGRKPFICLADPAQYVACSWDLREDEVGREHWLRFFVQHFETILNLGIEVEVAKGARPDDVAKRVDACRADFRGRFERYGREFAEAGRVTILTLDKWRDETLRAHGFIDPFELLKNRENLKMLPLLPAVCADLDGREIKDRIRAATEGVFAGNIFDMGAEATAKKFLGESPDFFAVRATLQTRPWLIDDFDALSDAMLEHVTRGRWKKIVFFIDNAGSDFLLGALPLMRLLCVHEARIVIASNERPSLNDMTAAECLRWWPEICRIEPRFGSLPIQIVSTGTGEPLIDLSEVSSELNHAADGADLMIIEGMGRGVESNLDAMFSCDALNIAMIKDSVIARRHGGKVFDCVCRFRGPGHLNSGANKLA